MAGRTPSTTSKVSTRLGARLLAFWEAGVESAASLILPWECPICGADCETEGVIEAFCKDCRAELIAAVGDVCWRCAMPVGPHSRRDGGCGDCRGRSLGFDRAISLGPYQGPIRELCLRLKHEPNAWIAPSMVELLLETRPELQHESRDALVVPIPLHWWRHCQRGYNQAEGLARGLAERLKLRFVSPLRRVVSTRKLSGLGRSERARLLKNAFTGRSRFEQVLKGRTVILVDDVLTTGATCGAAARALKKLGAKRVVATVIARAEGKGAGS